MCFIVQSCLGKRPQSPAVLAQVTLAFILLFSGLFVAAPAVGAEPPPPFELLLTFDNPPLTPLDGLVEDTRGGFFGITVGGGSYAVSSRPDSTTGHTLKRGAIFYFDPSGRLDKLYSLPLSLTDAGTSYPTVSFLSGPTLVSSPLLPNDFLYGLLSIRDGFSEATVLYHFDLAKNETTILRRFDPVTDGARPVGPLVEANQSIFGVLQGGAPGGSGAVFRFGIDRSYEQVHAFSGGPSDGGYPQGGLVLHNDYLYGTTSQGGQKGRGTLYRIPASGGILQVLHHFDLDTEGLSFGELSVGPDGLIYGANYTRGPEGCGTVYRFDPITAIPDNTELDILHSFSCDDSPSIPIGGGVVTTAAYYGATSEDPCTVYRLDLQSLEPKVLHTFPEDARCQGSLRLATDGFIYGQTGARNPSAALFTDIGPEQGRIFKINPVTDEVEVLYRLGTERPGRRPQALAQTADGAFYGTLRFGGRENRGTLYSHTLDGDFRVAYTFDDGAVGPDTITTLIEGSDNRLWGTQSDSGPQATGRVFAFDPAAGTFDVIREMPYYGESKPHGALIESPTSPGTFFGNSAGISPWVSNGYPYMVHDSGAGEPLWTDDQLRAYGVWSAIPVGKLWEANGALYGVYKEWGYSYYVFLAGGVFRINPNASVEVLKRFRFGEAWEPTAGLTERVHPSGNSTLFGTSKRGGQWNRGALYSITLDGTYRTIHSFPGAPDGEGPRAGLTHGPGGLLYGTTVRGGPEDFGTIFALTHDEQVLTLHEFDYGNGAHPDTGLLVGQDGALYGVTPYGGPDGGGVVYRIHVAPTADAGGPYSVAEGDSINVPLTATGTDPRGGGLTYVWDLDGDGTFETPGPDANFELSSADGPSMESVDVQVTNDLAISTTATAQVEIYNVAPTATLTATPATGLIVGDCFNLELLDPFDPSTADVDAGFTYSFDCDGDGTFEIEGTSPNVVCHTTAAGVVAAHGRIADKDGDSSEVSLMVEVFSPGQSIRTLLISTVEELYATGVIGRGQAWFLLGSLRVAAFVHDRFGPRPAARVLGGFVNLVEFFVRRGWLPPDVGELLTTLARRVIDALLGGGGVGCPVP
jgi:uncharacterized repeat protein (TIGR03803 family)